MAKKKKRQHFVGHSIARFFLTLLLIIVLCACFCGLAFAYYVHAYINPTVDVDISSISLNLNSFIYSTGADANEPVLYETLKGTENRIWIDGNEIPDYLKDAVVAIEDQRFYQHQGVDWKRTAGAALTWLRGGDETYGGSTITQQLIKNLTQQNEHSVKRKIIEMFRALALEKQVDDKSRILEMYLNTIYLGYNTYGVKTAAMTYFGKEVPDLTLAECAVLAGITNNPSKFDPYNYPENVKKRQETILDQMLEQGMITQQEHDQAVAEQLNYRPIQEYEEEINDVYSYFTDTVIRDVVSDLVAQKGYSESVAYKMVMSGGLQIYATIDTRIQGILDQEYNNNDNFPDMERDGLQPESAMVIVDKQGNVMGIAGGRGTKTKSMSGNYATLTRRQPGSSFKPLAVYGPAMDKGIIVPTSTVYDKALKMIDGRAWPRNDSGRTTNSPMVVKTAIAYSVNTIAVQVMNMLTPQESYNFLTQRLGFAAGPNALVSTRTNADGSVQTDIDYGPLALGGLTNGVTVREMAGGYSSFINDGVFAGTRTYTKVVDSNGNVILDNTPGTDLGFENVRTAYFMLECMQGVTSYGTASSAWIDGVETAGKTGTTSANYDRWFCGVTPKYAAAVWFGFEKSYTLSGLYGNPSTDMWVTVMRRVHENDSGLVFDSHPDDFVTMSYCMDSGLLPSGACRSAGRVATGRFWKGQEPTEICSHQGFKQYDQGASGVDVYDDSWDNDWNDSGDTGDDTQTGTTTDPSTIDPETGESVGGDTGGGDTGGGDTGGEDTGGGDTGGEDTGGGEELASDDPEA